MANKWRQSGEEQRRIAITLNPSLARSMRVLGLTPAIDAADGVPADGATQLTAALARYADAVDRAGRELNQVFGREEWNLMADVLNGCADVWEYSPNPSMYSLSLIAAEIEDGHRLDGLGYKWFDENDRKGSDAKVKVLLGKLGKLSSLHGDAIMAAIRFFWRHTEIDHSEARWWTPEFRLRAGVESNA